MTDQQALDSFEQRLAQELNQFVSSATDSRPAATIAAVAMRPRGLRASSRRSLSRKRLLILGLAAVLAVPVAYAGAARLGIVRMDQEALPPPAPIPGTSPIPADGWQALILRRVETAPSGVAIYALRADGAERLVRTLLDQSVGGELSEWGALSPDGWLVLTVQLAGWPAVLVDLKEPGSVPWVVPEANLGGIGPAWGPGGLLAADGGTLVPEDGSPTRRVAIIDRVGHAARVVPVPGGFIGGGPSIIWSADGGIVVTDGNGGYRTHYLDGRPDAIGIPELFEQRGKIGPGLAELQPCLLKTSCPEGTPLGSVVSTTPDGTSTVVYRPSDADRPESASYGTQAGEYWLLLDHIASRQFRLVHVERGQATDVAAIDRAPNWIFAGGGATSPDGSARLVDVTSDPDSRPAAVLVSLADGRTSFHHGFPVGFVRAAVVDAGSGAWQAGADSVPAGGAAYALPSVDELIAAETALNPGRTVNTKASHEGVAGDHSVGTTSVTVAKTGTVDIEFDCFGSRFATVTVKFSPPLESPCITAGGYGQGASVTQGETFTVEASADTSWRVVLYDPYVSP
jgi:hypothetical protein